MAFSPQCCHLQYCTASNKHWGQKAWVWGYTCMVRVWVAPGAIVKYEVKSIPSWGAGKLQVENLARISPYTGGYYMCKDIFYFHCNSWRLLPLSSHRHVYRTDQSKWELFPQITCVYIRAGPRGGTALFWLVGTCAIAHSLLFRSNLAAKPASTRRCWLM